MSKPARIAHPLSARPIALTVMLACSVLSTVRASAQSVVNDSSVVADSARHNFWFSAGLGVGSIGWSAGGAGAAGFWYSYNQFVGGAHAAIVAQFFGPEAKENSLLVGVRDLRRHGLLMVAAGLSALSGDAYKPSIQPVPRTEVGLAAVVQANVMLPMIGIGLEGFGARSPHRTVEGLILSLQLGWLGR